jgi:hypothetical protein
VKKKWIIMVLGSSLLLFGATAWAEGRIQSIQVMMERINIAVNGQTAELSKDSILYNGSIYVPLRSMSEMLGAEVSWDNSTRSVNLDFIPTQTGQIDAASQYGIYQYITLQNNSILAELIKALKSNDAKGMESARDRYNELQGIASGLKDEQLSKLLEKLGAAVELLRGGWISKNLDDYGVAWTIYNTNADAMNKLLKSKLSTDALKAK